MLRHTQLTVVLFMALFQTLACDTVSPVSASAPSTASSPAGCAATPIFVQFYDWFHTESWQEDAFVDPLDWSAIGVHGKDRASETFYARQFAYLKNLGATAISWEFHANIGGPYTTPTAEAVAALQKSGLRIAPFHDLEISFKAVYQADQVALPTLSNPGMIRPDSQTVKFIVDELKVFFASVPTELVARDKHGRTPIFVYGYGFDEQNKDPQRWDDFAVGLVKGVEALGVERPTFYWTARNAAFQEHLFLHHREHFVPFHFVLDTPQSQYGHDAVTWNLGFDNLGVARRDNLQRVIRLDPRYVQESGWLAGATRPALLFIYSWNEPFEGSMLMPTKKWGDTKSRLARAYIQRVQGCEQMPLPTTLIIVDDLSATYTTRQNDWHLHILEEMLLYPLRRLAPQSDVRTVSEVTLTEIDAHEIIVDLSSKKDSKVSAWIAQTMPAHRVAVFDPLAATDENVLGKLFIENPRYHPVNQAVSLVGRDTTLFARDDLVEGQPCKTCSVVRSADLPDVGQGAVRVPVVIRRGPHVWSSSYAGNDDILTAVFEVLYERPLGSTILYGEGMASQRLEIDPMTKVVTRNTLVRPSVNLLWPIPPDVDWFRAPDEVADDQFRFVFGLEG